MDEFETLTCEIASAILSCEAQFYGSQQRASVSIAELILAQVSANTIQAGPKIKAQRTCALTFKVRAHC